MVLDDHGDYKSQSVAVKAIASKFGCGRYTEVALQICTGELGGFCAPDPAACQDA